jgi:hypothetical protein
MGLYQNKKFHIIFPASTSSHPFSLEEKGLTSSLSGKEREIKRAVDRCLVVLKGTIF